MTVHPFRAPSQGPLKLGFLSAHNPHDRGSFSGTSYFAAKALAAHPDVHLRILGPHKPPSRLDRLFGTPKPPLQIEALDLEGLDCVLGLAASPLLADLADQRPDLPFVHITDATPAFLREFYGWSVPGAADAVEARIVRNALFTGYSSQTMAARARTDLVLPGPAPEAIPFGVNMENLPETCPRKPSLDKINLLFVGVDWARKGGDIAVAALDWLRQSGRNAELTVVGRLPERHKGHPAIRHIGFLDKNIPKKAARLSRLYRDAHLLLIPTRGDCTPMVVAEAMAHGTPVLATDIGGLSTQLGGSGAGRLLPLFAQPSQWAGAICEMTAQADHYEIMSDASFDRATMRFSWQSWAMEIASRTRKALYAQEKRDLKVAISS